MRPPQLVSAFLIGFTFLMTAGGAGCLPHAAAITTMVSQDDSAKASSAPVQLTGTEINMGKARAKVSPDLVGVYNEYRAYQDQGSRGVFRPKNPLIRVSDGRVVIDAVAAAEVAILRADLEALGLQGSATVGRIVSGQFPIPAIDALDALPSLQFARPSYASTRPAPRSPGSRQPLTPYPLPKKGGDPPKHD